MKYIVFSFDDGRADTFDCAFPIFKKHNFVFDLNIVSDFIENPLFYQKHSFKYSEPLSWRQLSEMHDYGVHINCHGHKHLNNIDDILLNKKILREKQLCSNNVGFASPYSFINYENINTIYSLIKEKEISYIRSGIQIKRLKKFYWVVFLLEKILHSKYFYYLLYKKCLKRKENFIENRYIESITIRNNTKFQELIYLIKKMKDEEIIVFNLHSVSAKSIDKNNTWSISNDLLVELLSWINQHDYEVTTLDDILEV